MDGILPLLLSKDTKQRLQGVESLVEYLDASAKYLTTSEIHDIAIASVSLLKDNNFKVCQGTLQALTLAAPFGSESLRGYLNDLVSAAAERLGDGKQPVREAARRLLLAFMEVFTPLTVIEKVASVAWAHKNWRVREEFTRTVCAAMTFFGGAPLPFQKLIIPTVVKLLEDSNSSVREASIICLEELYRHRGQKLRDELQQQSSIRPAQLKEIMVRFEKIEPATTAKGPLKAANNGEARPSTVASGSSGSSSSRRASPKARPISADSAAGPGAPAKSSQIPRFAFEARRTESHTGTSTSGRALTDEMVDGFLAATLEKVVQPVKVYTEKELAREVEKVVAALGPDQDWGARMAAMQKLEALVLGGAAEMGSFLPLLRQVREPLMAQLADRRSSVIKQVCHLLMMIAKVLQTTFEPEVEFYLPSLFKLTVITVLVMAESSDCCAKTLLHYCRGVRALPRILDTAMHDRAATIRARCCDYALLILERWGETPEVQKWVDMYESLIKACVVDAMGEVRALARLCFRVLAKVWPERSSKLLAMLDSSTQKLIIEEDAGSLRKSSPARVEKSRLPGPGASSLVASGAPASTSWSGPTSASWSGPTSTVETAIPGLPTAHRSFTAGAQLVDATSSVPGHRKAASGGALRVEVDTQLPESRSGSGGTTPRSAASAPSGGFQPLGGPAGGSGPAGGVVVAGTAARRVVRAGPSGARAGEGSTTSVVGIITGGAKRILAPPTPSPAERGVSGANSSAAGGAVRQAVPPASVQRGGVPEPARVASTSYDEYFSSLTTDPPALPEALTAGLASSSDWLARVAAFAAVRHSVRLGHVVEVMSGFKGVMRLYMDRLEDPHHKVAQAGLASLIELLSLPVLRRPFEPYLERVLPLVFSRLVDSKEATRQLATKALEVVSSCYGADLLLPALLRSMDAERNVKAKMAVVEYAVAALVQPPADGNEASMPGVGLLKQWLGKLAPFTVDKNAKIRETAVSGFVSAYTYLDTGAVLSFIAAMPSVEQAHLRRVLLQFTPRIEDDLLQMLAAKQGRHRPPPTPAEGPSSTRAASRGQQGVQQGWVNDDEGAEAVAEEEDKGLTKDYSGDVSGRGWASRRESAVEEGEWAEDGVEEQEAGGPARAEEVGSEDGGGYEELREVGEVHEYSEEDRQGWQRSVGEASGRLEGVPSGRMTRRASSSNGPRGLEPTAHILPVPGDVPSCVDWAVELSQLQGMLNGGAASKERGLQAVERLGVLSSDLYTEQAAGQLLMMVLDVVMRDPSTSLRVHVLSHELLLLLQEKAPLFENYLPILLFRLLACCKDPSRAVRSAAEDALSSVFEDFDPLVCIEALRPTIMEAEGRNLILTIQMLKLVVHRMSADTLWSVLEGLLPGLVQAFDNTSAEVRKAVVYCIVQMYQILGDELLAHLTPILSPSQMKLLTIYVNKLAHEPVGRPAQPPATLLEHP